MGSFFSLPTKFNQENLAEKGLFARPSLGILIPTPLY